MIYVEPAAWDINPIISAAGATAPDPVNIFLAQISYWVQEDVVKALNETNSTPDPATGKPPANVMEAPVKRLERILIQPQFVTTPESTTATDPSAPLPKVTLASPTGRVSNGL